MGQLLSSIDLDAAALPKSRHDDDVFDRLNHRISAALLVLFAVIVTTSQYVGDPINCWVPAHYDDSHEEYADDYCWIRNTYDLALDADIPAEHESHKRKMLPYYQWVPVILLTQALLFYLPYSIWKTLSNKSGIDIQSLVETGKSFTVTDLTEIRDKTLQYMTLMMDRYLRNYVSDGYCAGRCHMKCAVGRRSGNYLVITYLLVKVLYLANIIAQLFLLELFLGSNFSGYGIEFIRGFLRHGSEWSAVASVRFPRVTMCDLKVRRLGNVHRYTIMCVLPINLFNEKIFLFIWFWLILVGIATLFSLITWIMRFSNRHGRRQYVKQHLKYFGKLETEADRKKKSQKFVHRYLNQDGVFVLRLLAHNTNTITVSEFIATLWDNYEQKFVVNKYDDGD